MTNEEITQYWFESANDDFTAMEHLHEKGDYSWALFVGHLAVEKILKGCFVKRKGGMPPFTHGLLRLAEMAELDLTETRSDQLDTITTFNIRARYDDYKNEFKRKCTKEYTEKQIAVIKELKEWIEKKL